MKRPSSKFFGPLYDRWQAALYPLTYASWIMSGCDAKTGRPLALAFAGFERSKNYFRKLVFADAFEEQDLGRRWVWQLGSLEADFLVCEVPQAKARFFSPKSAYRLPAWLETEVDLKGAGEGLFKKKRYGEIRRKVKKYGLSAERRSDEASLKDFHENLYVPFIRGRHDDEAFIFDYEHLKGRFFSESQELILVMRAGEAVGGIVLDCSEKTARLWCMGVRGGSEEYLKMGVCEAAYYFSFLRIIEKGGDAANLGFCRPFLEDGVFRHKKHYGAKASYFHKESGYFHLLPLRSPAALEEFRAAHPFIRTASDGRFEVPPPLTEPSETASIEASQFANSGL